MSQPSHKPSHKVSRRTLFAGVGTAGAVAAAATLLPGVMQHDDGPPQPKEPPAKGGGYQLSEHVKRYYRSTRI